MPKVKLKQQLSYQFQYKRILQVGDINYGGHLSNDAVVTIAHEARLDFLRELGLSELDLGDGKTGIIMSDLAVNYLGEGFLFDELTILTQVDEIKSASFRVFHKMMREDKIIALVETGIITFDYAEHSIVEIPQSFLKKLSK